MNERNALYTDKRISIPKRNVMIFLIVCFTVLLAVFIGINALLQSSHRAELKQQASAVELAILVTVREDDIYGAVTYDASCENGLSQQASERIKALSGFEGDIYVTKTDEDSDLPSEMYIYGNKGYSAYYTKVEEHGKWEIVRNGSYRFF